MTTHIYKGNKIIEYSDSCFTAFFFEEDGSINNKDFQCLKDAEKYLDEKGYSVE